MSVSSPSYATAASATPATQAKPQTRPVYEPEKDTFKQSLYTHVLTNVFGPMRPTDSNYAYGLLKTVYTDSPLRFHIVSGIHQNHETDPLHFSVEVILEGVKMPFHVYGYYKSPKFIVTHLSIRDNQQEVKIASFSNTAKTWKDYNGE
jgi:hypothetical protein